MLFISKVVGILALASLTYTSQGLNILISNDDGFASAQLREMYRFMKSYGHNVLVVAPVDNESGQGGRAVYTVNRNLTTASEFNIVPAGAPSLGQDPTDTGVWYYNGTPAACIFVALDYVIPRYWQNRTVDLVMSGPNFGLNLGPFLYTLSGTMGATYAAIGRNIPAIAFSGGNSEQRSYQWINKTTPSNYSDPATIQGQLAANFTQHLISNTTSGSRVLPLGYGININTPLITSLINASCVSPRFYQTRMTGGAFTDSALYDNVTGLFTYGNLLTTGINRCINGDCALPGETDVLARGCSASASVFTVDYDAPLSVDQSLVRAALSPYVVTGTPSKMVRKVKRVISDMEIAASAPRRHE